MLNRVFSADAALHEELGDVYANQELFDNAEGEYSRALAIRPDSETARLGLAAAFVGKNQFDKALNVLQKAQSANPGNKEIHSLLAETSEKKGDRKAAEEEYLQAGKVNEGRQMKHSRRGDEYFAAKEYDKAVAEYRAALKEKPDWPETLMNPFPPSCLALWQMRPGLTVTV